LDNANNWTTIRGFYVRENRCPKKSVSNFTSDTSINLRNNIPTNLPLPFEYIERAKATVPSLFVTCHQGDGRDQLATSEDIHTLILDLNATSLCHERAFHFLFRCLDNQHTSSLSSDSSSVSAASIAAAPLQHTLSFFENETALLEKMRKKTS